MPDTRTWDAGGSDGVWITAANWTNDTAPITGDDVLFNATADIAVSNPGGGNDQIPALIFIGDGYTKDIGTSISNQLDITATKIVHRGKGTLWLYHATTIDDLIVHHTGNSRSLALDITRTLRNSIPTRFIVSRGRVTVSHTGVEPLRELIAVSGRDSKLTIEGPSWLRATVVGVVDGELILDTQAGTTIEDIYVLGGRLELKSQTDIATLHIAGGGVIVASGTGLITTANVMDGLLDYTRTQIKRTITTVNLWPNGTFKYNPDLTTITNPINEFDGRSVAP